MAHKNNKNSKQNKKSGQKTKAEVKKMQVETADEVGYSKESRKLGKNKPRKEDNQFIIGLLYNEKLKMKQLNKKRKFCFAKLSFFIYKDIFYLRYFSANFYIYTTIEIIYIPCYYISQFGNLTITNKKIRIDSEKLQIK